MSRDERLAVIENILFNNPDGVRVVELAGLCQGDRRTIYRDMAKLRANGVPIYQKRGRFFVSREYYHATVHLTLHESFALFTAVRVMAQLAEQHNPHAVSALAKLSIGLPEPIAAHVDIIAGMLRQKSVDRLFVHVAETLIRAWGEQRWVRIWTGHASEMLEIAPYFMEATASGVIYLVGLEATQERIRAFQLDQILRAELCPRRFKRHVSFRIESYLSDMTDIVHDDLPRQVRVMLAFRAETARLLLTQRPSLRVHVQAADDGRVVLTMFVRDWRSLTAWVRRFGADVEVLQPEELRRAVAVEARRVLALYEAVSVAPGE